MRRERASEWRVSGAAIKGAVRFFQKIMETLGLDEALRKTGVQKGNAVAVGDFGLEWQE